MIREAYCSDEVYELLRNNGFDAETQVLYDREGYTEPVITHQMAMAWLRECYSIHIVITPNWAEGDMRNSCEWKFEIIDLKTIERDYTNTSRYPSYEEAVEASLKYTLENLI